MFFYNCGKKSKEDYIARVGDKYLTKSKLIKMIPEGKKITGVDDSYLNSLISNWVRDEILFQKAKKSHFDKDENIKYKTEQYFRKLVINKYLSFYFQNEVGFSEKILKEYYNNNKNNYLRNDKSAKVKHYFTKKYDLAKEIKNLITSGNNELKGKVDSSYTMDIQFIESGNCIQEIDELIFENRPLTYYGPIVSDFGYHVIEVLERYDKGSYKSFSEVRDDIYKKLIHSEILENYVTFVDSLKNDVDWHVNDKKLKQLSGELW